MLVLTLRLRFCQRSTVVLSRFDGTLHVDLVVTSLLPYHHSCLNRTLPTNMYVVLHRPFAFQELSSACPVFSTFCSAPATCHILSTGGALLSFWLCLTLPLFLLPLSLKIKKKKSASSIETRSSLLTANINSDASWDNARLAEEMCAALGRSGVDALTWQHYSFGTVVLTLPDCFWSAAPRLTFVSITASAPDYVIVPGSPEAGNDPLLGFASNITWLGLTGVRFQNNATGNGINGDGYFNADISTFLQQRSETIQFLTLNDCRLRGSIPSNLTSFTRLETLSLNANQLSGALPLQWPGSLTIFSAYYNNLTGSLPPTLPPKVSTFDVTRNNLSGTLPATLLTELTAPEIVINLGDNSLTGTISSHLFTLRPSLESLTIDLASNQLSGSLPSTLITGSYNFPTRFLLSLSQNHLEGTLPSNWLSGTWDWISFQVLLPGNRLSGTLPSSYLTNINAPSLDEFTLDLSSNGFSGTMPSTFLSNINSATLRTLNLDLHNNTLNGSVPLIFEQLNDNSNLYRVNINLGFNEFSGALPSPFLPSATALPKIRFLTFILESNLLTGSIPVNLLERNALFVSLSVRLANNMLAGELPIFTPIAPSQLLLIDLSGSNISKSIPDNFWSAFTGSDESNVFTIGLAGCGLIGPIPTIPIGFSVNLDNNSLTSFSMEDTLATDVGLNGYSAISIRNNQLGGILNFTAHATYLELELYASGNSFTEIVFVEDVDYIKALDVSNNVNLVGSIPSIFFAETSTFKVLRARNTKISGPFPNATFDLDSYLSEIDLMNTTVDFCSGSRLPWGKRDFVYCNLQNTNATLCAYLYPVQCFSNDPAPVSSPIIPEPVPSPPGPSPVVPTPTPTPAPVRVPTGDSVRTSSALSVMFVMAVVLGLLSL